MNHPVTMALLLVKELRKLDLLEEVILANDIGCLRVCAHCGKLMTRDGRVPIRLIVPTDVCRQTIQTLIWMNWQTEPMPNWMLPMSFGQRGKVSCLLVVTLLLSDYKITKNMRTNAQILY